jgi:hypothetical protein
MLFTKAFRHYINNKASNSHPHPATFISALGLRTEHWPRAPQTLNPPLAAPILSARRCVRYVGWTSLCLGRPWFAVCLGVSLGVRLTVSHAMWVIRFWIFWIAVDAVVPRELTRASRSCAMPSVAVRGRLCPFFTFSVVQLRVRRHWW